MNKKIVSYLLGAYVFFTVYNTLIPFDFDYGFADLLQQIKRITWHFNLVGDERLSITDVVGNVILFIPLGFLSYMFLRDRNSEHPIRNSLLFGAALSLLIEITQLFMESRNTAVHDWLCNALGTWAGAVVAAIYSQKLAENTRRIFFDLLREKPFLLLVVIIGLAQLFSAVMPLTVSITFSHFVTNIKASNFVPFTYKSVGALFFNDPNIHDIEPFDHTAMIEDALFWMVVGYLLMLCYQLYWRDDPAAQKLLGKYSDWWWQKFVYLYHFIFTKIIKLNKTPSLNEWRRRQILIELPLLYFLIAEGAQLIIVTRTSDINDYISGCLGTFIGYWIYSRRQPIEKHLFVSAEDLLKFPLMLYAVFVVFSGLRPFDWTLDPAIIGIDLRTENLIPFYAYFRHTSLWDIFDLMNAIVYFLPISLFWSYKMQRNGVPYSIIYFLTTSAAVVLGLFMEVTQLFSPTRVAEITDVLSFGCGGALGTFLIYYYQTQISAPATSRKAAVQEIEQT